MPLGHRTIVRPPGQTKALFLKCIIKAFFTVDIS